MHYPFIKWMTLSLRCLKEYEHHFNFKSQFFNIIKKGCFTKSNKPLSTATLLSS